MLTLAAADTLAAQADASSSLTSTIFGLELSSGTETYKVLDQRQLASSGATIYTVPASTTTFIRSISVVNVTGSSHTFQYFRAGTASSNALSPPITVPPWGWATYEDREGWRVYSEQGGVLEQSMDGDPRAQYGIRSTTAAATVPSNVLGETIPRTVCDEVNGALITTGQLFMQLVWLDAGHTATSISLHAGGTAISAGTHQIFGLYDTSRNLLATTTDDTSTAWSANNMKTLALTATFSIVTTGLYYVGATISATTTMPTLKGAAAATASNMAGTAPIVRGVTSDSALTAMPNPAGAITASVNSMWASVNGN